MKKSLLVLLIAVYLLTVGFSPEDMEEASRAYILMDFDSSEVLEAYNENEQLEIASITKLMTYLLVKEAIDRGELSLSQTIVATKWDRRTGSSYKIKPGNEYSVEELLTASIVISGNDATALLAKMIAGNETEFANLMNRRAKKLGLKSAKFYNSTGLPIYPENVQNMMSTKDIALLSQYIIEKYPEVLKLSSIRELPVEGCEENVKNTNPILGVVDEIDGLKTGSTNKAGFCLVWTSNKNNRRLIGVNLGFKKMEERDIFTEKFARYAISEYEWYEYVKQGTAGEYLYVKGMKDPFVPICADESFYVYKKNARGLKKNIFILDKLKFPLKKNDIIGDIIIRDKGDNVIFKTDLRYMGAL